MKMKMLTKTEITDLKSSILQRYKNAKTELQYGNIYELLVSVMLSAQCTDKRVNLITPQLFQSYPDIKSLANANLESLKLLIQSCSFFNNKATNLIKMAKNVQKNFGGQIPLDERELIKLEGVGQKTAHVVLIEYSGANLMAVDTHVFRVSHRLGLTNAKNVRSTEMDLVKKFGDNLDALHQAMVLFGRYICTAKNPKCEELCFLKQFCKSKQSFKPN